MKKEYELPEMEIIVFSHIEVITTSGDDWYVDEIPGVDEWE